MGKEGTIRFRKLSSKKVDTKEGCEEFVERKGQRGY